MLAAYNWLNLTRSFLFKNKIQKDASKHKKKKKPEVFNFSAIHLIHDPQGTIIMTSQVPCWLYLPI